MRLINWIKRKKYVIGLKNHKKVIVKRGACVTTSCSFEGNTVIYENCYIKDSNIGFASYIHCECSIVKTKIGRYCSIAPRVRIVNGNHPTKEIVTTHPSIYAGKRYGDLLFNKKTEYEEYSYADHLNKYFVVIGNDVWIGDSVLILNGVTIGDGAIIAAGSVIAKDVEPYSIVAGVPAHKIRYRFTDNQIETLLEYQWWNKSLQFISDNIECFWNIDKMMELIKNDG